MISNRVAAIAYRSLIAATLVSAFALGAQAQLAPPAAIEGVYNGSYADAQGTTKFKLTLTRANATLKGALTFYPPGDPDTNGYTGNLMGIYNQANRQVQLRIGRWESRPPGGANILGMTGLFDPDSGQLSGKMVGRPTFEFTATRDAAESAKLASATPAQPPAINDDDASLDPRRRRALAQRAAAPPPPPTPPPAPQFANQSGTAISGVYTGSYFCAHGNNLNFKLSLLGNDNGQLKGFLTFDLPPDLYAKGSHVTYQLSGGFAWAVHQFQFTATPVGTPAPREYTMVHVVGSYVAGSDVINGQLPAEYCTGFRATRDKSVPTDVASIQAVMAAQNVPGAFEVITANLPENAPSAPDVKTAPPAQLASKDLVRKSKDYWDNYRTEIIRQVFDGGFGDDIGSDVRFQILFTSYVEMYSKYCQAFLPAQHETVTVTSVTVQKDGYGNIINEFQGQSINLEVDSRFVKYYRKYGESLQSNRQGLATAWGVISGRTSVNTYMDPALDIAKFFVIEKCQSAALRQLGENLLRAAAGDFSLQQAGAKISGAEAETDKDLPPGRFLHLVDACNAWYRDPANARFKTGRDSAYCECLAEKEEAAMKSGEEYYYANDFGPRFRGQIMQPKQYATDPAWPRLHPPIEDCRQ